jgi:hypothetical protein
MFVLVGGLVLSQPTYGQDEETEPDFVLVRVSPGMTLTQAEEALGLSPGTFSVTRDNRGRSFATLRTPWWRPWAPPAPYDMTFMDGQGLTIVSWERSEDEAPPPTYIWNVDSTTAEHCAMAHTDASPGQPAPREIYVVGGTDAVCGTAIANSFPPPRSWRRASY